MQQISKISNRRQVSIELEREELRNMRWARRRNMLLTGFGLAAGVGLIPTGLATALAGALRQLLGV